jgi:ribosomal protein L22
MTPADEKDPKDPAEETPDATEAKPKPKPKRKPAAKKPAASAAEVEKEVSEETAESVPRAEGDDEAPAPAEETPAKKETPKRKRDQPRERKPGEAPVLVHAKARYVRTSARKARLVCDHIRGKDVEQARAILSFTPRGAAKPWMKLLESAVANAEHNHELVGDELKIASVHADEGPTLKRYRPRAMGRATRIRKRTSHLSITLTPKE